MKNRCYIHPVTAVGKRTMDIALALLGIILTLPLYPFIALAIKLNSRGPIFNKHLRLGYQQSNYTCLFMIRQFRTCPVDSYPNKNSHPNDPGNDFQRLTSVGCFLKKTCLEQLPELWSVLLGDMSIVGPRPERPGINHKAESKLPCYSKSTYEVVPGMTGLTQIQQDVNQKLEGFRNRVAYNQAYALILSHPLLWLKTDSFILFKSLLVLLSGRR